MSRLVYKSAITVFSHEKLNVLVRCKGHPLPLGNNYVRYSNSNSDAELRFHTTLKLIIIKTVLWRDCS
jgi:hypothetical protein